MKRGSRGGPVPKSWGGRDNPLGLRTGNVAANPVLFPDTHSSTATDHSEDTLDEDTFYTPHSSESDRSSSISSLNSQPDMADLTDETIKKIIDGVRYDVQKQLHTNLAELEGKFKAEIGTLTAADLQDSASLRKVVQKANMTTGAGGVFCPPPFEGRTEDDPTEFIRKCKIFCDQALDGKEDDLRRFFPALLAKSAANWYVLHSIQDIQQWNAVEKVFLEAFNQVPEEELFRMVNRRKKTTETMDDFIEDFLRRMARCEVKEAELLDNFIRALPENYAERLIRKNLKSFLDAAKEARRLERKLTREKSDAMVASLEPMKVITDQMADLKTTIQRSAPKVNNVSKPKSQTCYYCEKDGHIARECFTKKRHIQLGVNASNSRDGQQMSDRQFNPPRGSASIRCFTCGGNHMARDCRRDSAPSFRGRGRGRGSFRGRGRGGRQNFNSGGRGRSVYNIESGEQTVNYAVSDPWTPNY